MFEPHHTRHLTEERQQLRKSVMKPALVAFGLAFLFFGIGGYWAFNAPIASATLASGTISPEGHRKTIQHLEGGLIQDIRVKDGDLVKKDDILIVLEETQALAAYKVQKARLMTLRAMEARLMAQESGSAQINWSFLPEEDGSEEMILDQIRIFEAQQKSEESERQILGKRVEQLKEEIDGLKAQIRSQGRQLALINDEVIMMRDLTDKGLARKPRLLELQRQKAEIEGRKAANQAQIARAEQSIGETHLQILNLDTRRQDDAANQLGEIRSELTGLDERMAGTRDILQRTVITAPVDGTVINMRANTIGGVVRPGDDILDIVPQTEELLIDAKVTITDIDDVQKGLSADVTLSALPQRNLPKIEGTVRQVSADRLQDEQSGEFYYLARIEIDQNKLKSLGLREELVPGMPADAMIFTGTQTFAEYLFIPLLESINRSFRES